MEDSQELIVLVYMVGMVDTAIYFVLTPRSSDVRRYIPDRCKHKRILESEGDAACKALSQIHSADTGT